MRSQRNLVLPKKGDATVGAGTPVELKVRGLSGDGIESTRSTVYKLVLIYL